VTFLIVPPKDKFAHLPFNCMQSYDIEKKNKNIKFIDEINMYSPLHIKIIIEEKYKLNYLQAISFENFIANTKKIQLLQYVGGTSRTIKHIIKAIQDYFLKTEKQQKLKIATYLR
jgi:hypothetical protein